MNDEMFAKINTLILNNRNGDTHFDCHLWSCRYFLRFISKYATFDGDGLCIAPLELYMKHKNYINIDRAYNLVLQQIGGTRGIEIKKGIHLYGGTGLISNGMIYYRINPDILTD